MTDKAGIARRFTESVARPIAAADAAPTEQWVKGTVTGHDPLTVLAQGGSHQVEPIGYAPPIGTEVWVRFGAGQAPLALVAPPAPFAMAAGTVSVSVTASATGSASVTFPASRFTQAPIVIATASGGGFDVSHSSITTSGCTINLRHVDASTPTISRTVHWTAIQMTADSAGG